MNNNFPFKLQPRYRSLNFLYFLLLISLIQIANNSQAQDPYLMQDIKVGDEANAVCYFPDGSK
ncbi:MAG: hypothetical protein ACP5E3_18145, partial [Bacteroidales bacterium]